MYKMSLGFSCLSTSRFIIDKEENHTIKKKWEYKLRAVVWPPKSLVSLLSWRHPYWLFLMNLGWIFIYIVQNAEAPHFWLHLRFYASNTINVWSQSSTIFSSFLTHLKGYLGQEVCFSWKHLDHLVNDNK